MSVKEIIENYQPCDMREESDKAQMLKFIDTFDDVLTRNNTFGHFSASAFVVNKERTKMVSVYHIINEGWTYPGGHADGSPDLLSVAARETWEETGLEPIILSEEPILLSSNPVPPHIKRGIFVSSHIHFDLLYLMEADDTIPLVFRSDESKGVKWIPFGEIDNEKMVDFVKPLVKKLILKAK